MQNARYDWLEQKMMADEFKQKLIDLGEEDFVMSTIQETKKTLDVVKEQTEGFQEGFLAGKKAVEEVK
tara:strand:- start:183 stop:386 length:204 start_codon:yes stop_codon:yes gene_type:complete